ncbi:MAG: gamma-glutamyl-gamma-aminobutyrate hydrolase family protein [Acidobacteriia bacterium]|nr:gamma-glutamyl-gamma-aminobutyrate hydrolase family protein [Terriglobia bacterium]
MAAWKPKLEPKRPRIAIPEPCSYDQEYSGRALPPYVRAVEACGGVAVVLPLGLPPEELAKRISRCSGVLLPGSKADIDPQKYNAEPHAKTAPSDPLRDAADELLLQDAYNLHKPIFGVCYGLQALNVWRSGTLVQHIETKVNHEAKREAQFAHQVMIEPGSLLEKEIGDVGPQGIPVNSSHHQAADVVGDGLRVVARSADDQIIEAVEGIMPDHYVLAVQWHPERSFEQDRWSRRLFESLVREAGAWRKPAQAAVAERE